MNPPVWPSSVRFCAAAGSAVRRAANNKHNGKQQSPEQRNQKRRNAKQRNPKLRDEVRNIRGDRMIFPFHSSSERTGERPWLIENHPVVTQIALSRLDPWPSTLDPVFLL